MKIAVLKERRPGERRVAASPETVKKFTDLGCSVTVEAGAGEGAALADAVFEEAGAKIAASPAATVKGADVVLKVQRPMTAAEVSSGDEDEEDQAANPEMDIVRMQQCEQVRQAIRELPLDLRAVVQLAYFHHYSYQEIAIRNQCPVNTVKDRMRQARRRLKPILVDQGIARSTGPQDSQSVAA